MKGGEGNVVTDSRAAVISESQRPRKEKMNGYIAAGGMRDEGTPQGDLRKQRKRTLSQKLNMPRMPYRQQRRANHTAIYILNFFLNETRVRNVRLILAFKRVAPFSLSCGATSWHIYLAWRLQGT